MATTRKMTDEIRQKLLGLNPFSSDSSIEYTPEFYNKKDESGEYIIPEKYRPIFVIRPYNQKELDDIKRFYINYSDKTKLEEIKKWARIVINSWEKLYDAGTMDIIPFEKDEDGFAKKDIVNTFSFNMCNSIIQKATQLSGITTEETEGLRS